MANWDSEPKPAWVEPPDPPRVGHRRKNRRRWCRGKVGVDHVLSTPTVSNWGVYYQERDAHRRPPCFRPEWYPRGWICHHEVRCVACGKIMNRLRDNECPDFTAEVTRFRSPKTRR